MLGEAIWSLKCQYRSAEVAKKGNFSSFLDFSQKTICRICSKCTQIYVFPCPIYWRDRIGCPILLRVSPKKNTQCVRITPVLARPKVGLICEVYVHFVRPHISASPSRYAQSRTKTVFPRFSAPIRLKKVQVQHSPS